MHRTFTAHGLALLAIGLLALPARAGDDTAGLRQELDQLKEQVRTLQSKRAQNLEHEIDGYLAAHEGFSGAQGDDAMRNITINAGLIAVNQNTVNQENGANRSVVSGLVELNFGFKITDNLGLFADLVANTQGHLDSNFFGGRQTLSGAFDGIGVDSTEGVRPQGGVQVSEAGARYALAAGNSTINLEAGLIDPRTRFLTTPYGNDARTGFLHNEFIDPSAISWITNQVNTPNSLGLFAWMSFGADKNFTVRGGWFNTPGRWFDSGQLYLEFHGRFDVRGRPLNVKFLVLLEGFYTPAGGDDDTCWGAVVDYEINDQLGAWFLLAGNSEDSNPVEFSWSIGAVWTGVGQRPDDQLGLAIGSATANETVTGTLPEDTELALEFFYKYMAEGGKLQITPHFMYVADPGGGTWDKSSLWILGVRFYIPF